MSATSETSSKPVVRQRANAGESPRPVLSFRVRADLQEKLKKSAVKIEVAMSEEVERRLIQSFELEERLALQDEIKAEMRGTITALEARISLMGEGDKLLWPDDSTRALGKAFAMTLMAARHASGQDWREDRSASLIVAGAVRRLMDRCSRDGASIMAELFDGARVAATADSIANTVGSYLDKAIPPLPEPELDVMQWTGRAFLVNEFRDAATGEVLETVTGPEWDAADPEQRPDTGDGYMAATARFKPIRHKVDAEVFTVHVMKDGSHKRISLDFTPASPGPQPQAKPTPEGTRWATPDEIAGMVPARGQLPPEIGDRALFDETMGPKRPDDGDVPPPAPSPAPARRRKAKAES